MGTTAPIQGANLRDFREQEPRWWNSHTRSQLKGRQLIQGANSGNNSSHTRSQLKGFQGASALIQGAMLMELREQQLPYKEPT